MKDRRPPVVFGWGLRRGDGDFFHAPCLLSEFADTRLQIETYIDGYRLRPVRVVLVPRAEYERLRELDRANSKNGV
jgi:hypothetical protein